MLVLVGPACCVCCKACPDSTRTSDAVIRDLRREAAWGCLELLIGHGARNDRSMQPSLVCDSARQFQVTCAKAAPVQKQRLTCVKWIFVDGPPTAAPREAGCWAGTGGRATPEDGLDHEPRLTSSMGLMRVPATRACAWRVPGVQGLQRPVRVGRCPPPLCCAALPSARRWLATVPMLLQAKGSSRSDTGGAQRLAGARQRKAARVARATRRAMRSGRGGRWQHAPTPAARAIRVRRRRRAGPFESPRRRGDELC
jgi:hypothetical protein